MGNANGGLNMEQVDNAMAAGLGLELATAVVDALQSLPVTEVVESSKNENIGLTEVFDNAQQNFPGLNLGGSNLAAGVAQLVNRAQSAIEKTPLKVEDDKTKQKGEGESDKKSSPILNN